MKTIYNNPIGYWVNLPSEKQATFHYVECRNLALPQSVKPVKWPRPKPTIFGHGFAIPNYFANASSKGLYTTSATHTKRIRAAAS